MSGEVRLLRVCLTGPESTGKTTLAMRLAERFGTVWVPEASRLYAERKAGGLDASDVEPIAREQVTLDDAATVEARTRGSSLLVLDADLLSTVVYAKHYYGAVPAAVERAASARCADLYLLCDVDVPWVADGVRDRPANREEMFALFRDELRARGIAPRVIRGGWDVRWRLAEEAVREAIRGRDV